MCTVACELSVYACFSVAVLFALRPLCCLTRANAAPSDAVDMYDSATGAWSTAQLNVARSFLAAASVGNVVLFAGGGTGGALLCREG